MLVVPLVLLACNPSTGDTDTGTGGSTGGSTGDGSTGDGSGSGSGETGGSTSEPTTGSEALSFTLDIWPIFAASCSCHTAMTPGPGGTFFMGADAPSAYAGLINVPSTVAGLDQIEPGSTATSYLYHKVAGTQLSVGGSGTSMPQGSTLPADQLATLSAWIDAGAPE